MINNLDKMKILKTNFKKEKNENKTRVENLYYKIVKTFMFYIL